MVIFLMAKLRLLVVLGLVAEVAVFVAVAAWIGLGWTLLAAFATSVLGVVLLGRQGVQALSDLRTRALSRQPAGREIGDAGLVAVGGLLMVLPGFLGDLLGLLCLLPVTRGLVRGLVARFLVAQLPVALRPAMRVRSARTGQVGPPGSGSTRMVPPVIEGEVIRDDPDAPRPPG